MSPIKPSSTEEEYFAREEAEKARRRLAEQQKKLSGQKRDELKKLHDMHCPKCGMDLLEIKYRDVVIDKCSSCGGVWLDDGELEHLLKNEGGIKALFAFFRDI